MTNSLRRRFSLFLLSSAFVLPITSGQINRVLQAENFALVQLNGWLWFMHAITITFLFLSSFKVFERLNIVRWIWLIVYPSVWIYLSVMASSNLLPNDAARVGLLFGSYLVLVGVVVYLSTHRFPVVSNFLSLFILLICFSLGSFPNLGIYLEYINRSQSFFIELIRHLNLSFTAVLTALFPGILLGYVSAQNPRLKEWILGLVNGFQVSPTLSMLALIMIPLTFISASFPILRSLGIRGIGFFPAYVVMTLYALMPITIHALTAFTYVDADLIESAQGLGLSPYHILVKIRLPLATPYLVVGLRLAFIQTLGNALLAGLVGGGGMGSIIFLGLSQSAFDLVLLGSLPIILMALIFEYFFESLEQRVFRWVGAKYD